MIDEAVIKHIEESESADDLAKILWQLLSSGISVWKEEDGTEIFYEIRALVDNYNGLKFEVRPREHAPPHFHVTYGNQTAAFSIENGNLTEGNFGIRETRIVKHYYQLAKHKIVDKWNKTRATDCLVGEYVAKDNDSRNDLLR